MAQSVYGGQLSWSGTSEQNVVGAANNYGGVGEYEITIRPNNAGIEVGGFELTVPQTGFLMVAGNEYKFRFRSVPGTNQENTLYVRNAGGGANSIDYLITSL